MKYKFLTNEEALQVTQKYGTPIYVYSEEILREICEKIVRFLKVEDISYKMHYSIKANANPTLLQIIKEEGLSVDTMSPGELNAAIAAGFDKKNILYVCNNVSADELAWAIDQDVLVCVDSVSQIDTLGKVRPGTDIMIRINPGATKIGHSDKVITSGEKTKFGITRDHIDEAKEIAKKHKLKIIGIHQHLGSLFLNDKIDNYIEGVKSGLEIAKQFDDLSIIDLGGGFGIPYKPEEKELDLNIIADKLVPILREFASNYHNKIEFKFEPGRIIPAECGIILGRVNSVKESYGINYVGTDVGMSVLIRPAMYQAYHHVEVIKKNETDEYIKATIVGNICESGDILAEDRDVLNPEVGDLVMVYDAGAYGYAMSSNYTGRSRPAEILFTKDRQFKIIREKDLL